MTAPARSRPIRSFLYVPGDRSDRIAKAFESAADAVLIDLEDAVAPTAKQRAREAVVDMLSAQNTGRPGRTWIRINSGDAGRADLEAIGVVAHRVGGLVLAKCDTVGWIDEVAAAAPEHIAICPLIESARAVGRLMSLCEHPRVTQCHLGEIDLIADLGARPGRADHLVDHARVQAVYASAAAGIAGPIGGVHPTIADTTGLMTASRHLAGLGFAGRPAIHPSQIEIINAAFTPTIDEVAAATLIAHRYDTALRGGRGAVRDDDGSMLDEAVVRHARRVLALAANVSRQNDDGSCGSQCSEM